MLVSVPLITQLSGKSLLLIHLFYANSLSVKCAVGATVELIIQSGATATTPEIVCRGKRMNGTFNCVPLGDWYIPVRSSSPFYLAHMRVGCISRKMLDSLLYCALVREHILTCNSQNSCILFGWFRSWVLMFVYAGSLSLGHCPSTSSHNVCSAKDSWNFYTTNFKDLQHIYHIHITTFDTYIWCVELNAVQ